MWRINASQFSLVHLKQQKQSLFSPRSPDQPCSQQLTGKLNWSYWCEGDFFLSNLQTDATCSCHATKEDHQISKRTKSQMQKQMASVVRELEGRVGQGNMWVPSKETELLWWVFKGLFTQWFHCLSARAGALKTSTYKLNAYNYSICMQMKGFGICCWVST